MASRHLQAVVQYIHKVAQPSECGEATEGELLRRFLSQRDEQAFAMIVRRHGPLVLTVCQRILSNIQDTEDAFQATFLVLVRKARSIAKQGSLASWLHGVARRVAVRVKTKARQREKFDRQLGPRPAPDSLQEVVWRDLRVLLDEEVQRLQGRYREPFVLCYMQGKTNDEAAKLLGCAKGTIDSRLSRARERLRQRLVRRGLGMSAGLVATMLSQRAGSASVPTVLELLAIKSAVSFSTGHWIAGILISRQVVSLTQEIVRAMFLTKLTIATIVTLFLGVTATSVGLLANNGQEAGSKEASKPEARQLAKESEQRESASAELKKGVDLTQLQLEMTQQEYLQVVSDLRKAMIELTLANNRKSKDSVHSSEKLQNLIENDPLVKSSTERVRKLEELLLQTRALGSENNERVQRLREELTKGKEELNDRRNEALPTAAKRLDMAAREDLEEKIKGLAERVEYLAALKKALKADLDELEKQVSKKNEIQKVMGSGSSRIDQLEKEVRELKALVEELKKRK